MSENVTSGLSTRLLVKTRKPAGAPSLTMKRKCTAKVRKNLVTAKFFTAINK